MHQEADAKTSNESICQLVSLINIIDKIGEEKKRVVRQDGKAFVEHLDSVLEA